MEGAMLEQKAFYSKIKDTIFRKTKLSTDILKKRFSVEEVAEEEISEENEVQPLIEDCYFVYEKTISIDEIQIYSTTIKASNSEEALVQGIKAILKDKSIREFDDYLYTYEWNCIFIDQFIKDENNELINLKEIEFNSPEHAIIHQRLNQFFKGNPQFVKEIEASLFDSDWNPPYSDEIQAYILEHDQRFIDLIKDQFDFITLDEEKGRAYFVVEGENPFKIIYSNNETSLIRDYFESTYDLTNKESLPFLYDFFANTGLGKYFYQDEKGICFDEETGRLRSDLKIFLTCEESIEEYLVKNFEKNAKHFFGDHEDYYQICLNYAMANDEIKQAIVFPKEMILYMIERCHELNIHYQLNSTPLN